MKKNNPFIVILSIVTVICIIYGSYTHIFGCFSGNHHINFLNPWRCANSTDWEIDETDNNSALSNIVEYEGTVDPFTKIESDCKVAAVKVTTGDEYSVQYRATNRIQPTIKVENGVLTIEQKQNTLNLVGTNNCDIQITVPEGVTLESADIQSDVGDLTVYKVNIKDITLQSDVGNVEASYLDSEDVELSSDVGDVFVKNVLFKELSAKSDVGDVTIESDGDLSEYQMDLDTSVGDVEFNHEEYGRKYKQKGSHGTIEASTSTGDVEVMFGN